MTIMQGASVLSRQGESCPPMRPTPKMVVGAVDGGPFLKKFLASEIRDAVCSFDSLYKAMLKCRLGVMWKDSTARLVNWGPASIFKHKKHDNGPTKITLPQLIHYCSSQETQG